MELVNCTSDINEYIKTFRDYLRQSGRSTSAIKTYPGWMRHMLSLLAPTPPDSITLEDIETLRQRLRDSGVREMSLRTYLYTCRVFFRMLEEQGYPLSLQPGSIKGPRTTETYRRLNPVV